MTTWTIIAAIVAVLAALGGLFKYFLHLSDKGLKDHKETVNGRFDVVNGRFKDHAEKLKSNTDDIKTVSDKVVLTREEMKSEYVKHEQLDKKLDAHGETLSSISDNLKAMARDLNQLIGAQNGKVKHTDDHE